MPAKVSEETLLRIIDLCASVEEKGLDPFEVDIPLMFQRLRGLLEKDRARELLYLDIEAVLGLGKVINQQGEWVKHRSSLLYLDPLLLLFRLQGLSVESLAEIMTRSWRPITAQEALSPTGLIEGLDYWRAKPPLAERGLRLWPFEGETVAEASREALLEMGLIHRQRFMGELEKLWGELRSKASGGEGVSYWSFIDAPSYDETVRRAYLTSFLVSYGYAELKIDPIEEKITLKPLEAGSGGQFKTRGEGVSFPISITRERWESGRRYG
ncbi:MAG: hypothetical protein QW390_00125 [Candidatus Bathyarchaeia archaeon]